MSMIEIFRIFILENVLFFHLSFYFKLDKKLKKAVRWETRAVESQEREWRMGSNLA